MLNLVTLYRRVRRNDPQRRLIGVGVGSVMLEVASFCTNSSRFSYVSSRICIKSGHTGNVDIRRFGTGRPPGAE